MAQRQRRGRVLRLGRIRRRVGRKRQLEHPRRRIRFGRPLDLRRNQRHGSPRFIGQRNQRNPLASTRTPTPIGCPAKLRPGWTEWTTTFLPRSHPAERPCSDDLFRMFIGSGGGYLIAKRSSTVGYWRLHSGAHNLTWVRQFDR